MGAVIECQTRSACDDVTQPSSCRSRTTHGTILNTFSADVVFFAAASVNGAELTLGIMSEISETSCNALQCITIADFRTFITMHSDAEQNVPIVLQ